MPDEEFNNINTRCGLHQRNSPAEPAVKIVNAGTIFTTPSYGKNDRIIDFTQKIECYRPPYRVLYALGHHQPAPCPGLGEGPQHQAPQDLPAYGRMVLGDA